MKTILCLAGVAALLLLAAENVFGDIVITRHASGFVNPLNSTDFSVRPAATIADPWRFINGQTQKVDGTWLAVSGSIAQVHPGEGVRINGSLEGVWQGTDFFVVNLPVSGGEGDLIPPAGVVLLVKPAGTYTYSTARGSTRTIRKYDYGLPGNEPQKTPAQIEANRQLTAKQAIKAKDAALKFNQKLAAEGDAYGQLRMAERYRDGDGVATNLYQARFLFMQSADQGNATAAKELVALTNSVPQK
jgi:hypothetical protein